jgi:transcriptional regulator with XRE-family HTH domain
MRGDRIDRIKLGEKIRSLREGVCLNRAEFIRRVGGSREYLSKVENGWRVPALSYCERIAEAAGISLHELLDDATLTSAVAHDDFTAEIASLVHRLSPRNRTTIIEVVHELSSRASQRYLHRGQLLRQAGVEGRR